MKIERQETQMVLCHHCHERKPVTTYAGIVASYCSERCKKNAANRRRKLRRRQRNSGTLPYCPRPDKVPYETWALADAAAHNEFVANDRLRFPYDNPCVCGSWHLSKHPTNRQPAEPKPEPKSELVPALDPADLAALLEHFGQDRQ